MLFAKCKCGGRATEGDLCFECMESELKRNLIGRSGRHPELNTLEQALSMIEDGELDDMGPEHWQAVAREKDGRYRRPR